MTHTYAFKWFGIFGMKKPICNDDVGDELNEFFISYFSSRQFFVLSTRNGKRQAIFQMLLIPIYVLKDYPSILFLFIVNLPSMSSSNVKRQMSRVRQIINVAHSIMLYQMYTIYINTYDNPYLMNANYIYQKCVCARVCVRSIHSSCPLVFISRLNGIFWSWCRPIRSTTSVVF